MSIQDTLARMSEVDAERQELSRQLKELTSNFGDLIREISERNGWGNKARPDWPYVHIFDDRASTTVVVHSDSLTFTPKRDAFGTAGALCRAWQCSIEHLDIPQELQGERPIGELEQWLVDCMAWIDGLDAKEAAK